MKENTKQLIISQGYNQEAIKSNKNLDLLIRWTPFACGLSGTIGLFLQNPYYFMFLGMLTAIGGLGSVSFYDYIYNYTLRYVLASGKVPLHGPQRRFGCSVGAILFITGGIGFYLENPWLAYIPTGFIICLAYIAAITQWCFASTLYNLLWGKQLNQCC
ncbi:MAG: DUF4395 family protein [Bacteroidota bacterium]